LPAVFRRCRVRLEWLIDLPKYWPARTAGQGTPPGITTEATGRQDLDTDANTNLRARPGAHVKQPVMKAQVVEDADVVTCVLVYDPG
jgi:hypothetical protein